MAVTNYYTVNGKIRGEGTAAGGYRPYGHDALGSVVATYDITGSLQNTYRNAPYGTQVAKTGTAPDPAFLYNGGSGYRTTGRSYSPYYVRKRHFDNKTAQWTTVDSMWPVQRPYGYSSSNPALLKDPTGQWPTLSELLAGAKGWISEPINWAGSVAVACMTFGLGTLVKSVEGGGHHRAPGQHIPATWLWVKIDMPILDWISGCQQKSRSCSDCLACCRTKLADRGALEGHCEDNCKSGFEYGCP